MRPPPILNAPTSVNPFFDEGRPNQVKAHEADGQNRHHQGDRYANCSHIDDEEAKACLGAHHFPCHQGRSTPCRARCEGPDAIPGKQRVTRF